MPSLTTWKKLSAASGLVFSVFVMMHYFCHYSLSLGWNVANGNLLRFRVIYQNPIIELGLLMSLLLHLTSNTVIYRRRRALLSQTKKTDEPSGSKNRILPGALELKAHRWAGYFMAASIFGHVAATRLGPYFVLPDPSVYDYSFPSDANRLLPFNLFTVYLAVFGLAGGWHTIFGVRSALTTLLRGSTVHGTPFPIPLKFVALVSHLLILSALLALRGWYYPIDLTEKAPLHQKIVTALGG